MEKEVIVEENMFNPVEQKESWKLVKNLRIICRAFLLGSNSSPRIWIKSKTNVPYRSLNRLWYRNLKLLDDDKNKGLLIKENSPSGSWIVVTTRWLSIAPYIDRIIDQMVEEMSDVTRNIPISICWTTGQDKPTLFTVLQPILQQLNRVNKLFQSNKASLTKQLRMSLWHSTPRLFKKLCTPDSYSQSGHPTRILMCASRPIICLFKHFGATFMLKAYQIQFRSECC